MLKSRPRTTDLSSEEMLRLLLWQALYHQDFNRAERPRLLFARWLYRNGRLSG